MKNTENAPEKQPETGPARIKFVPDMSLVESKGEAWRKWNVTISLPPYMPEPNPDPEKDIGKRIAYCRAQMDNLSVEALARYTKRFDREGVSRMAITRYEAGSVPTCRELRILADALDVPVRWLLFADGGSDGLMLTDEDARFIEVARRWMKSMSGQELPPFVADAREDYRKAEIATRKKWIAEDRGALEKD
jgi:transcriptional regulator with XRE-family HTH domain